LNLRCMTGDLQRCRVLADMYATGRGVERNLGRAAELYRKVCDAGVGEICNTLGEIYDEVPGFEVSPQEIASLYDRACTLNSAAGCLNFGLFLTAAGQPENGVLFYDRACVSGLAAGCHHLAAANELGEGVRQDLPRAIELYEQACSSEYVDSCLALATLYTEGTLLPPDAAKVAGYNARALQIYIDGCEAGNSPDCLQRDRLRTRIQLQQLQGVPGVTPGVIRPPGLLP